MSDDSVIDAVAREYAGFSLADIEEDTGNTDSEYCGYAKVFRQWSAEMLNVYVSDQHTPYRLAEAKVLLTDRYFAWRASVPKSHRNRIGEQGHKCVFQLFVEVYQKIRLCELAILTPAQLFAPPAPPPAPPSILGITLGEVMDEIE